MSTSHRHHVSCLQAQENRQSQEPRERVHFLLSVMKKCYCTRSVVLDSELSLAAHVSHITSVCYCQIRQLRLLRRSLSFEAAHALVRALIHSRLDYCNAVLAIAPQMLVALLPSVLLSAAWVVLRCPHRAYP